MPSIPFAGVQKIASSSASQPVFGTTTTAAAIPTYDQFAGNVQGANPSMTTLAVTSTAGFASGQYILVGLATQLGSVSPNLGQIKSVVSSTSMIVEGLNQNVASGAFVILSEEAQSVTIKPVVGNTAVIYIGSAQNLSSTSSNVLDILPNPTNVTYGFNYFHAETADRGHSYNTSTYWCFGTANDQFLANFSQG